MITVQTSQSHKNNFALPDMTALLDVIFILLVFFLLTANTVPQALEVSLPEDSQGQAKAVSQDNIITLTLFSDTDQWGIDKQQIGSWQQLTLQLEARVAERPDSKIVLAADNQVPLHKLMKLFSWLQSRNLSAAHILMRQPTP